MSRINTPESDSVFELWPLNVSTLQYLSMYFTFFKFLYRLNYMGLQGWIRYYVMHNLKLVIPWFGSTQLSLRAPAPQTQPI